MLVCSSDAERLLKQKLGSAERILKVAELCRKLETEQEKVLPFWTPGDMPGMTSGVHATHDQQQLFGAWHDLQGWHQLLAPLCCTSALTGCPSVSRGHVSCTWQT